PPPTEKGVRLRVIVRSMGDRGMWALWLALFLLATGLSVIAVVLPLVQQRLIDDAIVPRRIEALGPLLAIFAGVWLLTMLAGVAFSILRAYATERALLELRRRLFTKSVSLSVAFARQEHSGRTLSLFANDAPIASGLVCWNIVNIWQRATGVVLGAAVMFALSWQLALLVAIVPPVVLAVGALLTGPLRPMARDAQERAADVTTALQENLAGIREVIAFGRELRQTAQFTETLDRLLRLRMRLNVVQAAFGTGTSLLTVAVTVVIMGVGGYLVIEGRTTIGVLIAMYQLFGLVFQPAAEIVGEVAIAQRAVVSADRIYSFLDVSARVRESPTAHAPRQVSGTITFEGVHFAYRPEEPVLRDVSFSAMSGEVVALVGPSGAGKTTLTALIARFYDPTSGRVLLDGQDLRDLTLSGLRSQIAIVFQDTFLFATTIRENIAFGRDGTTEQEIVAAARAANAWEFITQLPDGLATRVGERGAQLSEGQRQRIAIARALLRDPRILILDEPTSALDARSEHLLQSALEHLMRGRTTFVIAHRLATVRRADRILVLENGRVMEQGTHTELIAHRGLYHEFSRLQFGDVTRQELVAAGGD
ncbi:MAG: ABC transporter ATP-binding protein, partial [Candidatus Limnocylindria bacterium]